jgi:outer membrane protein OmpA-like peptidoglycan-associated protein
MNAKSMSTLVLTLGLGACASAPQPNAALENARMAVQTAEADPNVNRYAALDLEAARKELTAADQAAARHDAADTAQQAYLASQTARLAQARAAAKADDAHVAAGQAERDRIQLAARTQEVQQAQAQANAAKAATAAATAEAARLQAQIDQLKATPTDRGLVLTLGDVLFDTGKAQLRSGADRKLDQLAQFLHDHPERRVEIDGFTDSTGSSAFNEQLSQLRADSVKSALLARGISPSRITTEGYGSAYPVASNAEPSGRQLNRRVEVVIGGDNGQPIAPRS